jgi:hypothetical protein
MDMTEGFPPGPGATPTHRYDTSGADAVLGDIDALLADVEPTPVPPPTVPGLVTHIGGPTVAPAPADTEPFMPYAAPAVPERPVRAGWGTPFGTFTSLDGGPSKVPRGEENDRIAPVDFTTQGGNVAQSFRGGVDLADAMRRGGPIYRTGQTIKALSRPIRAELRNSMEPTRGLPERIARRVVLGSMALIAAGTAVNQAINSEASDRTIAETLSAPGHGVDVLANKVGAQSHFGEALYSTLETHQDRLHVAIGAAAVISLVYAGGRMVRALRNRWSRS